MASKELFKSLLKNLEPFPKEKLTDLSFKEIQLERFRPLAGLKNTKKEQKTSISDIVSKMNPYKIKDLEIKDAEEFTEDSVIQQIKSLKSILSNQYRDYYYPTDKLLRPQGNPEYYNKLLADINGESKENIITGMRTVFFGK